MVLNKIFIQFELSNYKLKYINKSKNIDHILPLVFARFLASSVHTADIYWNFKFSFYSNCSFSGTKLKFKTFFVTLLVLKSDFSESVFSSYDLSFSLGCFLCEFS